MTEYESFLSTSVNICYNVRDDVRRIEGNVVKNEPVMSLPYMSERNENNGMRRNLRHLAIPYIKEV